MARPRGDIGQPGHAEHCVPVRVPGEAGGGNKRGPHRAEAHQGRAEGRVRRGVWRLGGDLGETFRRYYENKWGRD